MKYQIRQNGVHPLIDYVCWVIEILTYQQIAVAWNILRKQGIRIEWIQWMFLKPLSEFEEIDWRILIGLALALGEGRILAQDIRQYVCDMLNWAQINDTIDQVMFDPDEWPADASEYIDIPPVHELPFTVPPLPEAFWN